MVRHELCATCYGLMAATQAAKRTMCKKKKTSETFVNRYKAQEQTYRSDTISLIYTNCCFIVSPPYIPIFYLLCSKNILRVTSEWYSL